MVMESMATRKNDSEFAKILNAVFLVNVCFITLYVGCVDAFEWQLRTNLNMQEIYDDNLNLSQTAPQAGFVSEITPGLMLRGQSPSSNFNLNYRLQGLYNAENSGVAQAYHQLNMSSLLQPVQNTFYIQSSSSISQQNTNNGFIATDNIAGRNSMTQVENFSIAPYLTPHFGQYATGLLKAGYAGSYYNTPSNVAADSISNSQTILTQGGLTSGSYFGLLSWGLNYSSSNQQNDIGQTQQVANAGNVRFQSYSANTRYYLARQFNVFANAGYENNYYATVVNTPSQNSYNNGFFYTVGGQWKPSLWYSMQVGLGNNSTANIQYNPSTNLTSSVTYNYTTVGVNLGSSWNANIHYTTNMSSWGFIYQQSTTTVQEVLATQQTVFITNPQTGAQATPYLINLPNLVNDVFIVKHAAFNASYRTGKSTFSASVYNDRRTDQVTAELDTIYGLSGSWNWLIENRLNFYFTPTYQYETSNVITSNNTLYELSIGLTRGIPVYLGRPMLLNATLQGQHIKEISGGQGDSYTENRATAGFSVQF
jgi:uncharacterized protein (PEP-CTERM system associated)